MQVALIVVTSGSKMWLPALAGRSAHGLLREQPTHWLHGHAKARSCSAGWLFWPEETVALLPCASFAVSLTVTGMTPPVALQDSVNDTVDNGPTCVLILLPL